jgi:hypothetical protein
MPEQMMKMNALESLLDPHMIYLDITTGILGVIIAQLVIVGKNKFNIYNSSIYLLFSILIARIITDFLYYYLVSKTYSFGGSVSEFGYSIVMWFLLTGIMLKMSMNDTLLTFFSMILTMFAIARVTGWG